MISAIFLLARTTWVSGAESVAGAADGPGSNVEKLAGSLFTRYLLAFEFTSVLLVIAVVGAVVLARHSPVRRRRGIARTVDERSRGPGIWAWRPCCSPSAASAC